MGLNDSRVKLSSVTRLLAIVVFLCLFVVTRTVAKKYGTVPVPKKPTAEWVEPLSYLGNVTSVFGKRVQDYGVGNFPVPDKIYDVNVTRYRIHLEGNLEYTNGFIASIQNITRHPREYIWYLEESIAVVHFKLVLVNVSVFYDLRADLVALNTKGTAVLTFPQNNIDVRIAYNMTTNESSVVTMKTTSVAGPKTTYTPDSDVMRAVAYNARLTMANSLYGDLTTWIDNTLQSVLETIIRDLPFPLKVKRAKRRPGTRALFRRRPCRKGDRSGCRQVQRQAETDSSTRM